jgi:galactose mutarotase-like enzyme
METTTNECGTAWCAHPEVPVASAAGLPLGGSLLRLSAGDAVLEIAPALGGCATSWVVAGRERLALPAPLASFAASAKTGGVPLLAPFANRLRSDRFAWRGRDVDVARARGLKRDGNGLPIHGFLVRNTAWTEVGTSRDGDSVACRFSLVWTEADDRFAAFPFAHRLDVVHRLRPRSLEVTTTVHALDAAIPVPISFGWHPYFAVPSEEREGTFIDMPARSRVALDERALPIRVDGALSRTALAADRAVRLGTRSFDDLFAVGSASTWRITGPSSALEIAMDAAYPFVQLYATATSPFVSIEPMTAPGCALSDGVDVESAVVGRPYSAAWRAEIRI